MRGLAIKRTEVMRERLLNLAGEVPGAKFGLKIAALLLVLEGQQRGWVTRVLGLSRISLTRWIHCVNEQGVEALKEKPRPGRPGQLTARVYQKLEKHLEESPQKFGWSRVQWDGPVLTVHLKRYFGVKITVRQAQKWMHRLGYRMKQASYSYLQARKKDAQKFLVGLKKTQKSEKT